MLPKLIDATRTKLAPSRRTLGANLNFAMQPQMQTQWCWAAVATSTSLYFNAGSGWTQCALVNAEFRQTTCCRNGSSPACNKPWYLDRALQRTNNLRSKLPGTISFTVVQQKINSRQPVGVRIAWNGGGGHFVVLDGYNGNGGQFISVRDPLYGSSVYSYSAFSGSYHGNGSWTHTFYTKP